MQISIEDESLNVKGTSMTDMVISFDFYGKQHLIDLNYIADESSEFRFLDKMKHSLNDDLELMLSCVDDSLGIINYYTASVSILMKNGGNEIAYVSEKLFYPDDMLDYEYFYPEASDLFKFFNESVHRIINGLDDSITRHIRNYEGKIRSFVALRDGLNKSELVD